MPSVRLNTWITEGIISLLTSSNDLGKKPATMETQATKNTSNSNKTPTLSAQISIANCTSPKQSFYPSSKAVTHSPHP